MIEKHIHVRKTARYYVMGDMTRPSKRIWFVCHGYGQLAAQFIKEFDSLDDGNTLVVAPEGLHRFYVKGGRGTPGASWMTSEDRLADIDDYLAYLDGVYREVTASAELKGAQVNLLGFSQGTATAVRWALCGKRLFHNLVLVGGSYPPETDFEKSKKLWDSMTLHLLFGHNDPYLPAGSMQEETARLDRFGIPYKLVKYSGGHQVPGSLLSQLIET